MIDINPIPVQFYNEITHPGGLTWINLPDTAKKNKKKFYLLLEETITTSLQISRSPVFQISDFNKLVVVVVQCP